MSRIRGRDTRPEQLLRRALWKVGLRYRLNYRVPVGRPDIVFPGARLAIFIDGCFWHGCPVHYVRPRTSREFWSRKLRENVERDIRQTRVLEGKGWKVERFWEHDVFTRLDEIVERIRQMRDEKPRGRGSRRQPRVVAAEPLAGEALERWTLVDLHDPEWTETTDRVRSTAKW